MAQGRRCRRCRSLKRPSICDIAFAKGLRDARCLMRCTIYSSRQWRAGTRFVDNHINRSQKSRIYCTTVLEWNTADQGKWFGRIVVDMAHVCCTIVCEHEIRGRRKRVALLIDRALYNPGVDVFVLRYIYISTEMDAIIFVGNVVVVVSQRCCNNVHLLVVLTWWWLHATNAGALESACN